MFTNEHFSKASASSIDVALRMAQISLENAERLFKLQLSASKEALEGQAHVAQKLAEANNPQEAIHHLNQLTTQAIEKTIAHSRHLYDIVSQTQGEFARLAEDNLSTFNKIMVNNIDTLSKNVPTGSNVAIDALKSSFATTAAAINTFTRAAKQMADFADTSVKSAATAAADVAKNAAQRSANTSS